MVLWAVVAAIASIISGGVAYVEATKAAKDAKKNSKSLSGVLVNKNSNIDPIPVVYGTRRVGGTRVFVSTQDASGGDPNEFLYIALVLCEGPVQSITLPEIDDVSYPDDRWNYDDSFAYNVHLGTDAQTVDTLLQEANVDWSSDHRLRGVAYVAMRFKYNPDAFSGIPDVTWLVEGRTVYDPRDLSTAYSANMALCIRDYLTNARYGKGLASTQIDDDAFSDAADDCDESVTYYEDGSTGPIFECHMVLDTGETMLANLKTMLLGCRGYLPWSQGVYSLRIDKSASSVFAFTTDHILGGISIKSESRSDKANRYICTFINPDASWQEDTAIWPAQGSTEETAFLAADGGLPLAKEIDLETVTNFYVARDFARLLTLRSRNALRASFLATSEALELTVADVVTITHSTPGWSAKPFQIEQISLNDDGTCKVDVIEYDSTIYTYEVGAEQTAYPDTNLPNPFSVVAPTDLVVTEVARLGPDAGVVPFVQVSWTQAEDAFVVRYEVQYKPNSASDYFSVFTTEPRLESAGASVGTLYDIRVRSINSLGVRSAWLTGSYTPTGTYAILAATGLNDPESAKLWFSLTPDGVKARVEVTFDGAATVYPDYFVVFYAYEEEPNRLVITTDASTKLYLNAATTGIAGEFTLTAAAGSTSNAINFTDASGVIDIDLSGKWWLSVDDGVTQTRYHKVFESTSSTLTLPPGEELSITPEAGDTINVLELDWHDSRLPEFKLIDINGERIKHNGINFDGDYYLSVVTRGAEGTTQATQTGNVADYYPAYGPGTYSLVIPMAEFEKIDSVFRYSGTLDINTPPDFGWAAITCCFVKNASVSDGVKYVRSNIVPFEFAGAY